jgi:hypothetical protein
VIRKHIDIWAVLLLLLGAAVFAHSGGVATHWACGRLVFSRTVRPVVVRMTPFRLNRLPAPLHKAEVSPLRQI